MEDDEAKSWAATMAKRLKLSKYQGKCGLFSWNCDHGIFFNQSEENAWNAAEKFASLL